MGRRRITWADLVHWQHVRRQVLSQYDIDLLKELDATSPENALKDTPDG